eukprot:TRINITY_DN12270_c0_g2_i1.p1 TRINITY_DN12270_c0_g2~~TRINITY_DN12270_c0_g2_i1.p1  ORF type:complete len:560 (-),score=58.82 TRINITY_DN12270_c0_g2_i1:23-1672(-)
MEDGIRQTANCHACIKQRDCLDGPKMPSPAQSRVEGLERLRSPRHLPRDDGALRLSFDELLEQLAFVHKSLVAENLLLREQSACETATTIMPGSSQKHVTTDVGTSEFLAEATSEICLSPVPPSKASSSHEDVTRKMHSKFWDSRTNFRQATNLSDPQNPRNEETSFCGAFVRSSMFEGLVGTLIILNCITASVQQQYEGFAVGAKIGYPTTDYVRWDLSTHYFEKLEIIFVSLFTIEITVRLSVDRLSYFRSFANCFDTVVVGIGLLSLIVEEGKILINPNFSRVFRSAKILRALRLVIQHRSADTLKMLLKSLSSCCTTLGWSFLCISIVQFTATLLMTQLVRLYLDSSDDHKAAREVYSYFGTFTLSWLTMHEIFLANWVPPCRLLMTNVSEYYSVFFITYRCIIGFAVLNVINAVFVQQTMKVATADQEILILHKQRAKEDYVRKLNVLFGQLDASGDGTVSWDEFCVALSDPKGKAWMSALEIEASDMQGLFQLLDDGDGEINIQEFVRGALRLKGPARSLDVAVLISMVDDLVGRMDELCKRV